MLKSSLREPSGARAYRHEDVDRQLGCELAHLPVQLFRVRLKFQHVAHHSHFTLCRRFRENSERGFHGLRIRIVGIVVQDDSVIVLLNVHAHTRRLEFPDSLCDLLVRQAKILPHRSRRHSRIDHVPAKARNLDRKAPGRRLRDAPHFVRKIIFNVHCSVIAAFRFARPVESKAAGINARIHFRKRTALRASFPCLAAIRLSYGSIRYSLRSGAKRREKRVIAVQDGCSALLQAVEDLAFGAQDILPAAQISDVGVSDICDHCHVRLCDTDQIIDLTQMIHPHLENRDLVLRAEAKSSHGKTEMIVQITGGLARAIF